MQGTDISKQERDSRLMNEFDNFVAVDGESLTSANERFTTLINIMDRNKVCSREAHYDEIYDHLSQFELHVNASKAKKAVRNPDPLALVANSHAHSSHFHSSPSYFHSPQPYYVTHPSSVIDYEDDYQGEVQGDAQEDKLTTAMMNQAVIQDGCVDIQSKNVGYVGNGNRNAGRTNRNQATNAGNGLVQSIEEYDQNVQRIPRTQSTLGKTNVQCYNCNGKGHYARECPKPRVRDANVFKEQMLLVTKDEAGVHLDEEENDFMLDNAYGDNALEELNAAVIMMARIQPTDDKSDAELAYDAEFINEVNALQFDMINGLLSKSDNEQHHHEKLKTIIHTSADEQIDSDIIFDDLYVDNNSRQAEHDTNAHDQCLHDFESLIDNVQVEAENQRTMNIELKKQKQLLQRELETCKERVKEFENKPGQFLNYKEAYEELKNEINIEKEQLFNEKEEIREQL
ncbi:retrovirus-related pol polyprotein from transposon TNT 1-94 [Tanacetum coccineum]